MKKGYIQIPMLTYVALRGLIRDKEQVFATITDMDGLTLPTSNGQQHIMTEWGVKGADYPIIKYEKKGEIERFYLITIDED